MKQQHSTSAMQSNEQMKQTRPRFDGLIHKLSVWSKSSSDSSTSWLSIKVSSPRPVPSPPPTGDVPGSTSRGHLADKDRTSGSTCETKLKLLFPALTPSRSFTGRLFWLCNTQVDSELAACLAHKGEGRFAGGDPAAGDLDRNTGTSGDTRRSFLQLTLDPRTIFDWTFLLQCKSALLIKINF